MFRLKATTILARNSPSLWSALKTRLGSAPPRGHIAFCLSLNADEGTIAIIPKIWKSSIGCLSAPLPEAPDWVVCSILEVPYEMGRPFVSNIPGRPPAQVGRYHAMHRSARAQHYDSSFSSYNRAMGQHSLTGQTEKIPVPQGLTPRVQNMQTLVYFSDLSPEGVVDSLDYYYPHSIKLALVAASTPFVTGQPVTLFSNGNMLMSGAVGIGMFPQFEVVHGYEGLVPLSNTLQVTSSQGNLVYSLDGSNPSKLLTSAIGSRSTSATLNPKDEDFYLGLLAEDGQRFSKVYTIMSGDPSRGSLALEGEESPTEGSKVKLVQRSDVDMSDALHRLSRRKDAVTFVTSLKNVFSLVDDEPDSSNDAGANIVVLENTFKAASENGLLLNQPGGSTWRSTVEGGWASMSRLTPAPGN